MLVPHAVIGYSITQVVRWCENIPRRGAKRPRDEESPISVVDSETSTAAVSEAAETARWVLTDFALPLCMNHGRVTASHVDEAHDV